VDQLVQALVYGLTVGSVYALVAFGYSLIAS
jgi:branched-subunit amino acid ABC-type transport system permease component